MATIDIGPDQFVLDGPEYRRLLAINSHSAETLDRLYLEWSQFTRAKTNRQIALEAALDRIARSNPNKFEDPADHANWCMDQARRALEGK